MARACLLATPHPLPRFPVSAAQVLASAMHERQLSVGRSLYKQLAGKRRPWLDGARMLHWPVVLLYPETMASDLILDFCETDLFAAHIDEISGGVCRAGHRVGTTY